MKFNLIALIIAMGLMASFQTSCTCEDDDPPVVTCIDDIINDLKAAPVQSPPAVVTQWEYEGAVYYHVSANCCDQYSVLYDEECNAICAPDGGLIGTGDGECPNWVYEHDENITKTIYWEDPRG